MDVSVNKVVGWLKNKAGEVIYPIVIKFDGACEPVNPRGIATYGFLIYRNGVEVYRESGVVEPVMGETSTNNVAEYMALENALKYVRSRGWDGKIRIMGDSRLVIEQIKGHFAVKSMNTWEMYDRVMKLLEGMDYEAVWIPREENGEADAVSHSAYVKYLKEHPEIAERLREKGLLATEKQIRYLKYLGVEVYDYMGKREAGRLISKAKGEKVKGAKKKSKSGEKGLREVFEEHWQRLVNRSNRLGVPLPDKEKLWEKLKENYDSGFKCEYCGHKMVLKGGISIESRKFVWSFDHRVPLAHGGSNDLENIAVVCHRCNVVKGTMPAHAWEIMVRALQERVSEEEYEKAMDTAYTGAMSEKIARDERERIEAREKARREEIRIRSRTLEKKEGQRK